MALNSTPLSVLLPSLSALLLLQTASAQSTSFGVQEVVTTSANGAYSVYATDLDGDGDADVLSASFSDDKIAWYENLGGGSFGAQQVITTSADGLTKVYATDLDGDADVLSASLFDDKIAWYENFASVNVVCVGNVNSTGAGASLMASGSFEVVNNDTTLNASDLPLNQTVLFVNSRETILVANPGGSQGDLCIGSFSLGRHMNDIRDSGATGTASLALDLANVPTNLGRTAVVAGETWYWQAWYRDVDGGGAPTSNLSSAISVTFN
ncbi:VCBS repeat-containing protein [Planctomycetota bacterium]|nr:VCBS repeat-containing protein [Planctomycetota bacterium]